jgi:septal ring factor EnvC (AmiA/AmiB activator)
MKKASICLITAFAFAANFYVPSTWAADPSSTPTSSPGELEKLDREISKNKEKVDSKISEISTRQTKLEKDMAQFGANSPQVKEAQEALKSMRNELIDLKTDLYKNSAKKKVEEGQPIETDTSC